MRGKQKPFSQRQLTKILTLSESKIVDILEKSSAIEEGKIPSFFYKLPFFMKHTFFTPIHISDTISIQTSEKLSFEHLKQLEFLLLRAKKKGSSLESVVSCSIMIREFKEDFLLFLAELEKVKITIKKDNYTWTKISLFSSVRMEEDMLHVTFSTHVHLLFFIDYLVPIHTFLDRVEQFSLDETKMLLRLLLCMPTALSMGVKMDTLVTRGFNWSQQIQVSMMNDIKKNISILATFGISPRTASTGIGSGFNYSSSTYKSLPHPIYALDDLDKLSDEMKTTSGANNTSSNKSSVCFSSLEMNDKFKNKALMMGVSNSEIDDLFKLFKIIYSQSKKEYKNAFLVWGNFLKKNANIDEGKENIGAAKNIVLDEEMRRIAKEHNLNEMDIVDEFKVFTSYNIDNKRTSPNWHSAWEAWVIRGKRHKRENAFVTKTKIENEFYLVRLVSNEIKKLLQNKGISPTAVAREEVVVEDITFSTYPLPPSLGKGEETIFSFVDKGLQGKVIHSFLHGSEELAHNQIAEVIDA